MAGRTFLRDSANWVDGSPHHTGVRSSDPPRSQSLRRCNAHLDEAHDRRFPRHHRPDPVRPGVPAAPRPPPPPPARSTRPRRPASTTRPAAPSGRPPVEATAPPPASRPKRRSPRPTPSTTDPAPDPPTTLVAPPVGGGHGPIVDPFPGGGVVVDPGPVVRDHRGDNAGGGGVTVSDTPVVRDHRGEGDGPDRPGPPGRRRVVRRAPLRRHGLLPLTELPSQRPRTRPAAPRGRRSLSRSAGLRPPRPPSRRWRWRASNDAPARSHATRATRASTRTTAPAPG